MNTRNGFSLAELLLVMLILDQISAFTIPKILNAQASTKEKALFRETYAALNEILYIGSLQDPNYDREKFIADVEAKINGAKVCRTQSVANGCWDASQVDSGSEGTQGGFILHNGVTVTGIGMTGGAPAEWVAIDLNGAKGPNIVGEDSLFMVVCFQDNAADCTSWSHPDYTGTKGRRGTISPGWSTPTLNKFYTFMGK